jgi:uncharacterized protein (TIGR02118 family)
VTSGAARNPPAPRFGINRRERTMIKVSILYPYRENGHFDVDYYCVTHMPLAAKLFGPSLKGWSVDVGINAGPPGTPPPYVAAGHFLFDSADDFYKVFKPASAQLTADIPNYTDGGNGTILISEIKISV